jgi:hypothetical protein
MFNDYFDSVREPVDDQPDGWIATTRRQGGERVATGCESFASKRPLPAIGYADAPGGVSNNRRDSR